MEGIQQRINQAYEDWDYYYYPDRNAKCKPIVDDLLKEVDALIEGVNQSKKKERAKLYYLKGKLLDILTEYQKSAEELLNKSIKLNPVNGDCWNCLAHVLFKKGDNNGAKKAIDMALQNKGKNKVSLRYLSVLLRTQEGVDVQRRKNIQQSVKVIKDALMLDFKDPGTWYFLGNAYLSNFFANFKKFDELANALKAYNEAEKYFKVKYPDLYMNRANVLAHMESYQEALQDFARAQQIDPSLKNEERVSGIKKRMQFTKVSFERMKQLKRTKVQQMLQDVPNSLKDKDKGEILPIKKLSERFNPNKLLSAKILNKLTTQNDIPSSFLVMDSQGNFVCLSIYNADETINQKIKKDTLVTIKDPEVKMIKIGQFSYPSVQVFQIMKIFINGKQLTRTEFNPNVVYNQTFQK